MRLHAREGEENSSKKRYAKVMGRLGGAWLSKFSHLPLDGTGGFTFILDGERDEFQNHATLPHTVRFSNVDALLDQPRDVPRTEMIG